MIEGKGASSKCVIAVSRSYPPVGPRSNREEHPAVSGSLTSDHDLRIIAERGVRLSSRMHRSCAYYSHPYKSHANIPQSRNSLSCVCLKSPTSKTHYVQRIASCEKVGGQRQNSYRHRVHDLSFAFPCCSCCAFPTFIRFSCKF